ncbi:MAG: excinuclease ABC subunit UvrC [Ruminococcaceae bacterium]|nr:excinuclease ABC subunit UvrC [Oscillospiraceae bacterium]
MFDPKEELKRVPEKPGVYLMHDRDDVVMYVGKAVNLKRRLSSYFQKTGHNQRITNMISLIERFEYIVTDSEYEALVLECNLIKKYSPKYNVLLKDDKGFPYIKVTLNEEYPKAVLARKTENDGCKYFGPFCSSDAVYTTINSLRSLFPLRLCNKASGTGNKGRVCLNYHIGLCSGPCKGKISHEEYMKHVKGMCDFLSGKTGEVRKTIETEMKQAAEELNFELAAKLRDKLKAFDRIAQEQKVEKISGDNCDVISVAKNQKNACIQIFFMRGGKILGREFYILEDSGEEAEKDLILAFITQFYSNNKLIPSKIYTDPEIDEKERELTEKMLFVLSGKKCAIINAKRGEMRKITLMVRNNAAITLLNFESKGNKIKVQDLKVLESLRSILHLSEVPRRIEAYDISNLGSSEINASMVVFKDGKPFKQDYRRFKMKDIHEQNDVGSMVETIRRRFTHLLQGDKGFEEKPDLVLIDGGIGQTNAAKAVIESFGLNVPVWGMVKDDRHRTRALIGETGEIPLKEEPDLWHFVSSIQDETHRVAVEYNRKLTEKRYRKSILDGVSGIGEKRKIALLKHFGTYAAMKKATVEELAGVSGMNVKAAESVYEALRESNK